MLDSRTLNFYDHERIQIMQRDIDAPRWAHQPVELRTLPRGAYFIRKPNARTVYIREHYNPRDAFGPASFCCTDADDVSRSIQLKPSTLVYPDFTY